MASAGARIDHRLPYRPEVDGLRAVAVLPVILFHAGFAAFSGGYVGVDVFFVISGYLITSIILTEKAAGTFTIAGFYERRARRILPALFLVVAVCVPIAWRVLPQGEWRSFSRSVAALSVFASNILFWRETGYFDTATEMKPLIHTWSLAVEEQYYVIYPLFLTLAWRLGLRWIVAILATAAIISLAAAQIVVSQMPAAAFYLLPTRGWELAVGALAAMFLWRRDPITTATHQLMSALGLALIGYSVFAFSRSTPFPSLYALLPTVGAGLIIVFATAHTVVGRVLGSKPLVAIGLISYSAYLWHQPLFAFARHAQPSGVSPAQLASLAALSLLLAYLSWRFVEQPFRNPRRVARRGVMAMAIAGTLSLALIAVAAQYVQPPKKSLDDMQVAATKLRTVRPCALDDLPAALHPNCRVFGATTVPSLLLTGDSHAEALQFALEEALLARGQSAYSFTVGGCTPIKDVALNAAAVFAPCLEMNRYIADRFLQKNRMETIVLMSRWTAHWLGAPFDNREGGIEPRLFAGSEGAVLTGVVAGARTTDKTAIAQLYRDGLDALASHSQVVLVYPVPEAGWHVPSVIADAYTRRIPITPDLASVSSATFTQRNAAIHALFDSVATPLIRIKPERMFCDTTVAGRCVTQQAGVPFYYDDDHLSDVGARLVVAEILRAIDRR
ncbi:MAG TPA: acyltransferase family protein [Vicinamibacterales bacterium]|nr:acyltransferase family protein [Vicinamibacterales bacterium]